MCTSRFSVSLFVPASIHHHAEKSMLSTRRIVVGLGELLWDLLPSGKQLGGAPANFAYITSLLGDHGIPASRLGEDALGAEAIHCLNELTLSTEFIQNDTDHPTGTVKVEVDASGQPCFEISEAAAWDFLEWTPQWQKLAEQSDAVCFGSLAQRSERSRSTIRSFLVAAHNAVRVFDVNFRQHFYTTEVFAESLKLATVVKLNHEELPRIMRIFGLEHRSEEGSVRCLLSRYKLKLVCVTRGDNGSLLASADEIDEHPGFKVKVADTVGAGDAFTAAMVHGYLRGTSLPEINETSNRVGAWVASQPGAMPALKPGGLAQTLANIG
jgi:fructokinase